MKKACKKEKQVSWQKDAGRKWEKDGEGRENRLKFGRRKEKFLEERGIKIEEVERTKEEKRIGWKK